eukprot:TRINITY_DN8304_c0_g1_i1.p1 TRINITY_DN8304_c0_g1~~TRINITY_DN8304_c0_g1_i1.p1  ORF type:complete len:249 (+),score=96.15 TRINITY_DN8304_c0_g1_i1:176-922(+)
MDEYAFSEETQILLKDYVSASVSGGSSIDAAARSAPPDSLVSLVRHVARFGVTCYPWDSMRVLVANTLAVNLSAFAEKHSSSLPEVQQRYARIRTSLECMPHPPFTIQRICEIVLCPEKYYKHATKLLNALEKLARVQLPLCTMSPAEYNQCVLEGLEKEQEAQAYKREDEERRRKIEAAAAAEASPEAEERQEQKEEEQEDGMEVGVRESESEENDALLAAVDGKMVAREEEDAPEAEGAGEQMELE